MKLIIKASIFHFFLISGLILFFLGYYPLSNLCGLLSLPLMHDALLYQQKSVFAISEANYFLRTNYNKVFLDINPNAWKLKIRSKRVIWWRVFFNSMNNKPS